MAEDRKRRRSPAELEAVFVLVVLAVIVGAGAGGWFFGHSKGTTENVIEATPAPAGHQGVGLPAHEFGDPAKGALLFEEKGCADCHSYNGQGGTDAPPLDYMKGHLSAREIAGMSGDIWNHVPMMLPHFEEEGLPFPTFTQDEMADLIAYLHSGD